MARPLDLTGQRFGRLVAVTCVGSRARQRVWHCRCDCGGSSEPTAHELTTGNTQSCGCLHRERAVDMGRANATHGGVGTRLYRIWRNMIQRCENPRHVAFDRYGGAGIAVCSEWRDDFAAFRRWALANGYRDDLTIERRDGRRGYGPDNCCWATRKEQQRNTTTNHIITHDGVALPLVEWAERSNITRDTLAYRIRKGWPIAIALNKPPRPWTRRTC